MKPWRRKRKLSTFFNLEKDPDEVGVPKIMSSDQFSPSGLPPAEPVLNENRVVQKSFRGWPLMLWLAVIILLLGLGALLCAKYVFDYEIEELANPFRERPVRQNQPH